MRPDHDAIEASRPGDREVALLAAEVRRLRAVLASEQTLTDAEREAVERGYCSLMGVEDMSAECTRWDAEAAATLRGLLERMG